METKRAMILAALCAFALHACAAPPSEPLNTQPAIDLEPAVDPDAVDQTPEQQLLAEDDKIRVALLVPQSGENAEIGAALLNAAQLALFDTRDPRVELRVYDSEGTVEGARRAATAALEDDVRVIIGPLFSASVKVVADVVRGYDIPVFAFSNDVSAAASSVYLMGLQPAQEVERVIRYAARQAHIDRFAALIPEGVYGETVLKSFGRTIADEGDEVRAIQIYPRDVAALTDPVKAIADYDRRSRWLREERAFLNDMNDDMANESLERLENKQTLTQPQFDAILVAEGGALLRTLAPLLAIYEVDPSKIQFLGTGLWNDPGLTREPPLHGAWFAAPPEGGYLEFTQRFITAFDHVPPRVAALAYDAMALTALLAREPDITRRFSNEAIEEPDGFYGVTGLFRFLSDGTNERGLAIVEIQPQGFQTIVEAPKSFEDFLLLSSGQEISADPIILISAGEAR